MITLEQLLASRDARAKHQQDLLTAWPGNTLICLTVQFPGPVKRSASSLIVGAAGLAALLDKFGSVVRHAQVRDLETGYEAYILVPLPATLVKKTCCQIEDSHPLGRLMDIDVITANVMPGPSTTVMPGLTGHLLDRSAVGLPPRRCLLCEQPARYCMRAHTHSLEELLYKIEQMVADFT